MQAQTIIRSNGRPLPTYTEQERLTALAIYGETLSARTASEETDIPESTIRTWAKSEEGIATISDLRSAVRVKCAHKFAQIAILAAEQLVDRIQNGDEVIDSKGNYYRRKMPGKDLAHCMSIAADKHALVSGTSGELTPANAQLLSIVDKLLQMGAERGVIATPSTKQSDQNTTGSGQVPENTGLDQG